jgi:hypothetical protein
MTRTFLPVASLALLSAACASEEVPPQPDPAKVEHLLARLETEATAVAPAAEKPAFPEKTEETLTKADRLVDSLEKVPTERIDPSLAEALIVR